MKRIKRLLPNNRFARNVTVLAGGTAGAQLLMVAAAPLLTRLYSPEDFGLLAVFSGLLGVLSVVASLRYELAIPLPKSDEEAANIVVLCLLTVFCTASLTAIVVLVAGSRIAGLLSVPALDRYFWLLPVGLLFVGVYSVFNYAGIRAKQFPIISRTLIWQKIITLAVQVLGFKLGGFALLFGDTVGRGAGSVSLGRIALAQPSQRNWRWSGVRDAAIRYRQFPMFSSWAGLFNAAGQQLPPLMFAAFFSVGAAGLYALAQRVLALPMAVIGKAIGNVFFSDAADAYRQNRLGLLVQSVHAILAQVAMPPALALIIIGPELFTLVFGQEWSRAGEFARWMTPWLYMVFITSPLSTLFSIMEKQRQGLMFQAALLLARIAAIATGAWYGDLLVAVILFSVVSALFWVFFLVWIALQTESKLTAILTPAKQALVASVVCIAPLSLGITSSPISAVWWLALGATVSLIAIHYYRLSSKVYRL